MARLPLPPSPISDNCPQFPAHFSQENSPKPLDSVLTLCGGALPLSHGPPCKTPSATRPPAHPGPIYVRWAGWSGLLREQAPANRRPGREAAFLGALIPLVQQSQVTRTILKTCTGLPDSAHSTGRMVTSSRLLDLWLPPPMLSLSPTASCLRVLAETPPSLPTALAPLL